MSRAYIANKRNDRYDQRKQINRRRRHSIFNNDDLRDPVGPAEQHASTKNHQICPVVSGLVYCGLEVIWICGNTVSIYNTKITELVGAVGLVGWVITLRNSPVRVQLWLPHS